MNDFIISSFLLQAPINCISANVCNVQTACLECLRQLQCRHAVSCAIPWLQCQSLADRDHSTHPRRASTALPRPWSSSCKHDLAEFPTPHTWWSLHRDCSRHRMNEVRYWWSSMLDVPKPCPAGNQNTQNIDLKFTNLVNVKPKFLSHTKFFGNLQWKSYKNRSAFAEVVTKNQSGCFLLEHSVLNPITSLPSSGLCTG